MSMAVVCGAIGPRVGLLGERQDILLSNKTVGDIRQNESSGHGHCHTHGAVPNRKEEGGMKEV